MLLPEHRAEIGIDGINDIRVCRDEGEFLESAIGNQPSENHGRLHGPRSSIHRFELHLPEKLQVLDALGCDRGVRAFPAAALRVAAECRPITAAALAESDPAAEQKRGTHKEKFVSCAHCPGSPKEYSTLSNVPR